ncbi:MAG TPA: FKBP-type peptidyl-prolyl cis-trans isomerase, partial [Cellvibrionaceae bacterium]|nr:FKBP-type peptidyl-prolyl cis-trans isomerase [Cellvibrionaceae bacterium]
MSISKDQVVSVHYRVSEAGGPEFEHNFDTTPMVYLHGHNNPMPALEQALEGKTVADNLEVTLAEADAYGPYIKGATQRCRIKKINRRAKRLNPGHRSTSFAAFGLK